MTLPFVINSPKCVILISHCTAALESLMVSSLCNVHDCGGCPHSSVCHRCLLSRCVAAGGVSDALVAWRLFVVVFGFFHCQSVKVACQLPCSFSAKSSLLTIVVCSCGLAVGVCCSRCVFVIGSVVGSTIVSSCLSHCASSRVILVSCRSCRVIYCPISYRPLLVAYVPYSIVSYVAIRVFSCEDPF